MTDNNCSQLILHAAQFPNSCAKRKYCKAPNNFLPGAIAGPTRMISPLFSISTLSFLARDRRHRLMTSLPPDPSRAIGQELTRSMVEINCPRAQQRHTFPHFVHCQFRGFLDASSHLYKRVCRSVRPAFFSMSRLWEKMVGNDWENSLKAPNS